MDTPLDKGKLKVRLQSSILAGEGGGCSRLEGEYLERKKVGNKEPIGVSLSDMVIGVMEAGGLEEGCGCLCSSP